MLERAEETEEPICPKMLGQEHDWVLQQHAARTESSLGRRDEDREITQVQSCRPLLQIVFLKHDDNC